MNGVAWGGGLLDEEDNKEKDGNMLQSLQQYYKLHESQDYSVIYTGVVYLQYKEGSSR